jgi:hypothetical protein
MENMDMEKVFLNIEEFPNSNHSETESERTNEEPSRNNSLHEHSLSKGKIRNTRTEKHNLKIEGKMNRDLIREDMIKGEHSKYCKKDCSNGIDEDDVYNIRCDIHRKKYGNAQKIKIIQILGYTRIKGDKNHHWHNFQGKQICEQFWITAIAKISRTLYNRCVTMKNKHIVSLPARTKRTTPNRGGAALSFMNTYVKYYCDYDPASTSKTHLLPPGTTIHKNFHEYQQEEGAISEIPILKERRFRQIWDVNVSHKVSFSTVGKVSLCDICVEYEYKKSQEKDIVKREELDIQWNVHKQQQL